MTCIRHIYVGILSKQLSNETPSVLSIYRLNLICMADAIAVL